MRIKVMGTHIHFTWSDIVGTLLFCAFLWVGLWMALGISFLFDNWAEVWQGLLH